MKMAGLVIRQYNEQLDLFKYLILWHTGGIFVDLEDEPRDDDYKVSGLLLLDDINHHIDNADAILIFDNNNNISSSSSNSYFLPL
jgi:mannosyltransferase OCH1-like enzyme